MNTRRFAVMIFLLCAACQGSGSAPARPVTLQPEHVQTQGPTPTYNIVTRVAHTPTSAQAQTLIKTEIPLTITHTPLPATGATASPDSDRPLLIPRLLQADYSPQVTRLVLGFNIHPVYRGKSNIFSEIYDSTLTDQDGREIPGISMERTAPEVATLEFAPLPASVTALTLRAELILRGVPAQSPLAIDLSGRQLDQPWPIQSQIRFGNAVVQLHTARLLREETGAPPDAKQQVSLELHAENAMLNGAQLICIFLTPQPPPIEGSVGCGQEPGGIESTVSLGAPVDLNAVVPMPTGLVLLEATGDFLLPGEWETTWTVEK